MREIKLELFDLFAEIDDAVVEMIKMPQLGETVSDPQRLLKLVKVRHYLTTFTRNFMIQFFYAHGVVLKGFYPERLDEIKKKRLRRKPSQMIGLLAEYMHIDNDVVGNPYVRASEDLKELYCTFLPKLFKVFRAEGSHAITNYKEVISRSESISTSIARNCAL